MLVINFALDTREAQALQQLIGELVEKVEAGIWSSNEDSIPLLSLSIYLSRCGIHWTDESSDLYWWSFSSEFPGYVAESYEEFEKTTASPIFTTEEAALAWTAEVKPRTEVYMYAHWGRGHMGPGFIWNPEAQLNEEQQSENPEGE